MKTIKQKPGRMRRAVRSVAVLLCVLAAYVVLSDMKLTPRAAIRMGEQYYGIYEPTHTVAMQRMRIGWQNYRVYLTAGENSLYCGAARLTPSGWDIIFMGDAISCADGESVHVGNWCPGSLNKIIGQEIIFGRVDDPNIALLTIEEWGGRDWTKPGCENEKLRRLRTVTVEEFIEDGGCRYFLLDAREREEKQDLCGGKGVLHITGYDAMHREILRREMRSAQIASYRRGGARQSCRSLCIDARGKRHELSVNSSAHTLTEKSQNDILLWNSYSFISSERRQDMLKLQQIVKDYQAGDTTVHALRGVSLQFRESEFVAILGHSGCGKTTLLNIIGGLDQYTSGDLVINGKSTKDFSDSDWDSYRNHSVGFVFQSYNLIPHQTVLSNVELALTLSGVSKSERRERAIKALESVGLGDQLDKKPNQMSGGQMQRVAIARALVNDPDILLADEPTGALDSETSVQVMEILKKISKDRLIIMVTHNPELAETYASRIVRLKDGEIVDDSAPYAGGTEKPAAQGKEKKPSMGFGTALSLSLNNLMTKKGRTFLTAFAGSIGIIGIALILSLSNGIQTYIDRVQEDTLSSYPLTIEAESMDMSSMVSSMMGVHAQDEGDGEQHDLDAVYSNNIMYDMMSSFASAETQTNNLKDFKTYLEGDDELSSHISSISYDYDLGMSIYAKDTDGKVFKSDVTELLQTCMSELYGGDYSSYFERFGSAYSAMETWEQMLPPQDSESGELVGDLLHEQYDLIYGSWPQNYDEVMLIVNKDNEISDLVIYSLGLSAQDEVVESMQHMLDGSEFDSKDIQSWSYEDLCNMSFKIVLPAERYQYDSASGTYTDVSTTDTGLDFLYNSDDVGTRVKIVGILRPNENAVSSMLSGAIGYTSALTDYLVEKAGQTEILQKQKEDPDTDVILGLPFLTDDYSVSDEQKEADVTDYLEGLSVTERAAAYTAMMSVPSEEYLSAIVEQQMGSLDRASIEQMVISAYAQQMSVDEATVKSYIAQMDDDTLFGYVEQSIREQVTEQYAAGVQARLSNMTSDQLAMALDLALEKSPAVKPLTSEQYNWLYDNYMPATVSNGTYEDNLKLLGDVDLASPKTINIYASTFADKDAIADAIEQYNSSVSEDDQIDYTDYVALLMSSVTTIINAISYVLIAFVAISLIVSSIMIGIITYISVLERTKEIGILRAIGASKRDISRVFNAETLIEGFCSGAIGIGITLLLIIPINLVVHHLTGIESLNAILPPVGGAALVVISMALTFIAGLIPSGIAARKDPVEALRTE